MKRLIPAFVAVLVFGGALGYGLTRWLENEPAAATEDGRKVLYWRDPMKPDVKFDKPGKSPFMNMDLEPVYADDATSGAQVNVSASAAQNLGVRIGKVERAALDSQLSAVGMVAFDEELLEVVQARVDGYVSRLYVKTTLAPVRRGQPLVDVVAPAWLAAQEEYLALLDAPSARGAEIRAAARQRLIVLGVPEGAIRRLEKERKTTSSTTIYSPGEGVVAELGVREGASFTTGALLFRINSLQKVWAIAQIPETQVSAVTPGAKVGVRATAWPGEVLHGRVVAILPDLDAGTRTLQVRVEIDNPGSRLAPGMFVSLAFAATVTTPQLLVPSEAVIVTGERSVVIVARDGGGFDAVDVELGAESADKTVVLSGLGEGQSIVLSGQFLIDSEASLNSAVSRMASDALPASAAPVTHQAMGKIVTLTPTAVTIAHEAVPSLQWRAMTMSFAPPVAGMPEKVAVGDEVHFTFVDAGSGRYRIESIGKHGSPGEMP